MTTTTLDPILPIHPVSPDGTIVGLNRFIGPYFNVTNDQTFDELLAEARCPLNPWEKKLTPESFLLYVRHPYSVNFTVVHFPYRGYGHDYGVSEQLAKETFEKAGLRPATFRELMIFLSHTDDLCDDFDSLVALGSSTAAELFLQWESRPWWKKFLDWLCGKKKGVPSYAIVEGFRTTDHSRCVRLTKGDGCWKNEKLFLATYIPLPGDENLVPYEITMEAYEALPATADYSEEALKTTVPLGTFFRTNDGRVCQLVAGTDMFAHQHGSLSIPERGWRYYRPVWKKGK